MVAPVVSMPNTIKAWPQSGRPTQLFVQHSGECPLAPGYARSLTNWSNTTGVQASWHSFVGPDERVRQVPWNLGAWTQGAANQYAIGMEVTGYAAYTREQWTTGHGPAMLENLAHEWVYYWRIEKSLGNEIPLRWLTDNEVRAVLNGNRTIKGFCTHGQIEPATRWDPGPNFPREELLARIRQLIAGAPTVPAKPPAPAQEENMPTPREYALAVWGLEGPARRSDGVKRTMWRLEADKEIQNEQLLAAVEGLTQIVAAQDNDLTPEQITEAVDAAYQRAEARRAAVSAEQEDPTQ